MNLIDAVADHTPWSRYAAGLPAAEYPATGATAVPIAPRGRQPGHDRPPARSRRVVAMARVATGPLLLASLAAAGLVADGVADDD